MFYAPLRVRVAPGRFRAPDVLVWLDTNDPRNQNAFWLGADLVVEIVSPDDVERDTVVKRGDYAVTGIPEYWIVHPIEATVTVRHLVDKVWAVHGVFHAGEMVTSRRLPGFAVPVDAVLKAE